VKSPAFQFYPDDFVGSGTVALLRDHEIGIYLMLLCLDWSDDGFVFPDPADVDELDRLAAWCKTDRKRLVAAWKRLAQAFPASEDSRRRNPRLERERAKQAVWREKSSTGGKKGAATRWGKDDRPHKGGDKGGHEMVVTKPSPTVSPFDDTPFPSPFPSPVTTKTTTASISPNDGETRPTRTGEVTPADRPVKKARRPDTWLTPIGAAWERVNGPGSFPYAQAARELKPLVDAGIGPDEIARRLAWYLENKGSASVLPPDQLARKAFTPSVRDFRLRHGQFDPSAPSEAA